MQTAGHRVVGCSRPAESMPSSGLHVVPKALLPALKNAYREPHWTALNGAHSQYLWRFSHIKQAEAGLNGSKHSYLRERVDRRHQKPLVIQMLRHPGTSRISADSSILITASCNNTERRPLKKKDKRDIWSLRRQRRLIVDAA
jgi:hypothetical protein